MGLGLSYYPASLLWSPGPRPSPVFRSAVCDCLSLNVSVSQTNRALQRWLDNGIVLVPQRLRLVRKVPYWERDADADVSNFVVNEGGRLQRPAECSGAAWAVMRACWETNAGSRPTFEALKLKLRSAYAAAVAAAAQATCVICCERPPAMVLQPCGHVCVCQDCAPAVQTCPMCRMPVAGCMRVYV